MKRIKSSKPTRRAIVQIIPAQNAWAYFFTKTDGVFHSKYPIAAWALSKRHEVFGLISPVGNLIVADDFGNDESLGKHQLRVSYEIFGSDCKPEVEHFEALKLVQQKFNEAGKP